MSAIATTSTQSSDARALRRKKGSRMNLRLAASRRQWQTAYSTSVGNVAERMRESTRSSDLGGGCTCRVSACPCVRDCGSEDSRVWRTVGILNTRRFSRRFACVAPATRLRALWPLRRPSICRKENRSERLTAREPTLTDHVPPNLSFNPRRNPTTGPDPGRGRHSGNDTHCELPHAD